MATSRLGRLISAYDATLPLERASTPPAAWYRDPEIADLETLGVFGSHWQYVAPLSQIEKPGDYVTADIAGNPIVVVRGRDGVLRGFYNVCRHHAAEIATSPCGNAASLVCPYHGWTYGLDGALKGIPQFDGVVNFDKAQNGLVPVRVEAWESFVFVSLRSDGPALREYLGRMAEGVAGLALSKLRFTERRSYDLNCNWKVYVDNYLDGGYHVPFIHEGLASVIDDKTYKIETFGIVCLQSSPITGGGDADTNSVRRGDMAYYYWLHPNFMLNWYEGVMDVNLVVPLAVDRCRVTFDFFFAADDTDEARHRQSVAVAERVQREDIAICESVQRGIGSRGYDTGRLSVRREAGEHLFHRLLHADLIKTASALATPAAGYSAY